MRLRSRAILQDSDQTSYEELPRKTQRRVRSSTEQNEMCVQFGDNRRLTRNYGENIQKKAVTVAAKEDTAYCYRSCT